MMTRLLLLGATFVAASGLLVHANQPEAIPARASFASFPMQIGGWSGHAAPDFARGVLETLGVDEFVNRYYVSNGDVAHLYIGYYRSQRQGSSIHSPMNCLPGAGWVPIESSRVPLAADGSPSPAVDVNRLIIQKGLDKQLVLYWYQSHGRTIASEYWSKIFLVLDSIRLHRSDAALVRIIVPVDANRADGERRAQRAALDLAEKLFPAFRRYLPS